MCLHYSEAKTGAFAPLPRARLFCQVKSGRKHLLLLIDLYVCNFLATKTKLCQSQRMPMPLPSFAHNSSRFALQQKRSCILLCFISVCWVKGACFCIARCGFHLHWLLLWSLALFDSACYACLCRGKPTLVRASTSLYGTPLVWQTQRKHSLGLRSAAEGKPYEWWIACAPFARSAEKVLASPLFFVILNGLNCKIIAREDYMQVFIFRRSESYMKKSWHIISS